MDGPRSAPSRSPTRHRAMIAKAGRRLIATSPPIRTTDRPSKGHPVGRVAYKSAETHRGSELARDTPRPRGGLPYAIAHARERRVQEGLNCLRDCIERGPTELIFTSHRFVWLAPCIEGGRHRHGQRVRFRNINVCSSAARRCFAMMGRAVPRRARSGRSFTREFGRGRGIVYA